MNNQRITRVEVIDHTPCNRCNGTGIYRSPTDTAAGQSISFYGPCGHCDGLGSKGRQVVTHDKAVEVELQLQDNEKTLKIFIRDRE